MFQSSPTLTVDDTFDADEENILPTEPIEQPAEPAHNTTLNTTPNTQQTPRQITTKRKRDEEEMLLIRGLATNIAANAKQSTPTVSTTDEFDTCGSYVANNIRTNLESSVQWHKNLAQHKINDILFQAQMGAYYPNPQMRQPSPENQKSG